MQNIQTSKPNIDLNTDKSVKMRSPTYTVRFKQNTVDQNSNDSIMESPVIKKSTSEPRFKESMKTQVTNQSSTEGTTTSSSSSSSDTSWDNMKTMEVPYIRRPPTEINADNQSSYEKNSIVITKKPVKKPENKQNDLEAFQNKFKSENEYFKFDDEFVKNEDKIVNNLVDNLLNKIEMNRNSGSDSQWSEDQEQNIDDIHKVDGERFIDEFNHVPQNYQNKKTELIQKDERPVNVNNNAHIQQQSEVKAKVPYVIY